MRKIVFEKLFYYFKGYLILELCGDSKERFINLCKNKEIEIFNNLREELGDILLQVVLHSVIAEEEQIFTLEDVVNEIEEIKSDNIYIVDDDFLFNEERVKKFIKLI